MGPVESCFDGVGSNSVGLRKPTSHSTRSISLLSTRRSRSSPVLLPSPMAENGTGYPPAAEKRSWADEEETALPPPPTTTSGGSSGVEGETSELKKIEDVTISAEKEINQLGESVGSEIKAVRKSLLSS